jgi:hypothetical protein
MLSSVHFGSAATLPPIQRRRSVRRSVSRRFNPHHVFLNVPFDAGYERLFVALIAAIVGLGRTPRCVLEIAETGQGRLTRLLQILGECGVSIHDLSRVGTPVRFNMPFELGLACAVSELNRHRHHYVLLERQRHRLTRTLSDLNGRDPYVHEGSPRQVVVRILDVLKSTNGESDITSILKLDRELCRATRLLKRQYRASTIFASRSLFTAVVAAAATLAADARLIRP